MLCNQFLFVCFFVFLFFVFVVVFVLFCFFVLFFLDQWVEMEFLIPLTALQPGMADRNFKDFLLKGSFKLLTNIRCFFF